MKWLLYLFVFNVAYVTNMIYIQLMLKKIPNFRWSQQMQAKEEYSDHCQASSTHVLFLITIREKGQQCSWMNATVN